MAHDLGPDLDQILAQARMRSVLGLLRQVQCLLWVNILLLALANVTESLGGTPDVIRAKTDIRPIGAIA